ARLRTSTLGRPNTIATWHWCSPIWTTAPGRVPPTPAGCRVTKPGRAGHTSWPGASWVRATRRYAAPRKRSSAPGRLARRPTAPPFAPARRPGPAAAGRERSVGLGRRRALLGRPFRPFRRCGIAFDAADHQGEILTRSRRAGAPSPGDAVGGDQHAPNPRGRL